MLRNSLPLYLVVILAIVLIGSSARAQTRCLTAEEVKKFTDQINEDTKRPFEKKLSEQLNKLAAKEQQRVENNVADNKSDATILKTLRTAREQNTNELCSLIKQYGWPTRDLVGDEAEQSAFFLLRNSAAPDLQRD